MQTELLTLIFEEAKKQCESKNDSVGLGAMYSAIVSVGRDSHVLEGKTYDIQEYEALRRAVARDEPEGTAVPPVKSEDSLTGQEKQLCAFRIWLNMSTRSAVDAHQYLRKQVKTARETGHPEKMTAGTERPIKAMTETEHPVKAAAETEHLVKAAAEKEHSVKKPTMEQLAAKTVQIREQLMQKVIGQDNIIAEFANGYFEGELSAFTEKNRCRPKAIFLFAGSPGVGKTYLATEAAKALELPVKRFDMSSYADDVSASELTGAGANFKSPKPGALTGFVHDHPSSMLIFDEIEKAHPKVINLFLQVLDAGTLYDNKYEANIAFGETVIIFTTNAGKSLYQDTTKHNYSDVPKKVILDALEKECHPVTGRPVFPQAICSRLATGNVLLFNHLTAHQLSTIAARKLMEQQASLYQEASILSEDAESLATTLLFSLGGHCDARNMTAAAKRFFSAELFELYRLAGTDRKAMAAGGIQKIRWQLDIDRAEPIIRQLYHVPEDNTFLFFGSEEARMQAQQMQEKGRMLYASNLDEVKQILQEHELSFAAIDYFHGCSEKMSYLNAGDVHSEGRKCWEVLQQYEPELPVFIWETDNYQYNREEVLSFLGKGAEDILHISFSDRNACKATLDQLQVQLWQQKALDTLAFRHQVLNYETAQSLSEDGTIGIIKVFDPHLATAVEADDQKDVLSAEEKPDIHWSDIVVSEDVKSELQYFQSYLKDAKSFLKKGAATPKGILLYGPPGTGKTSLAKVMAAESDVIFLTASADQFISKWVGEGPQAVHRIFSIARKYAPAILFIDEIDAIGRRRTEEAFHDGRQEILNALLTEMDGFKTSVKKPVLVMAATNLGGNNGSTGALDPALVRRFDRSICIDLPDRAGRIQLLKMLRNKHQILRISDDMLQNLAERSIGMSPALLEGAVNAAIREAIRCGTEVSDSRMDEAFEKYNHGEEKHWNRADLIKTARHEAGHAVVCNYFGEEPSYLTVAARDNHGGYMMYSAAEGKGVYTKKELLRQIAVSLGGRAAELVYYGEEEGLSTGPSSDLETATAIARKMICNYGMYNEIAAGIVMQNEVSETVSQSIEQKVNAIIQEQLNLSVAIIKENADKMAQLVDTLMEKTHLNKQEIQEVLND